MARKATISIVGDASSYLAAIKAANAATTRLATNLARTGIVSATAFSPTELAASSAAIQSAVKQQSAVAVKQHGMVTRATKAAAIATVAGGRQVVSSTMKSTKSIVSMGKETAKLKESLAKVPPPEHHANMGRTVRGALAGAGAFSTLGRSIAYASASFLAFAVLGGIFRQAVAAAAKFETSLTRIVGLAGGAKEQVKQFGEQMLKLGPKVAVGPNELADALYFIASAGIAANDQMAVLTTSAKASVAGLGETKVVADAVTSAINAYGAANLSAKKATDVLVDTVHYGKGEAAEFAPVIGTVASFAAALGIKFNEVGASLAAMTRLGIPAQTAAIELQAVFSNILHPTEQARKSIAAVGLSFEGLTKQFKEHGLLSVFATLKQALGGDATALAKAFTNIRALRGVISILGKNSQETFQIFKKMAGSTNALAIAFGTASKDPTTRFKAFGAAMQSVQIAIGSALLPTVVKMTDAIGQWLSKGDNIKNLNKNVMTLAHALEDVFRSIKAVLGPFVALAGLLGHTAGWGNFFKIVLAGWFALKIASRGAAAAAMEAGKATEIASLKAAAAQARLNAGRANVAAGGTGAKGSKLSSRVDPQVAARAKAAEASYRHQAAEAEKQAGAIAGSSKRASNASARAWIASSVRTEKALVKGAYNIAKSQSKLTSSIRMDEKKRFVVTSGGAGPPRMAPTTYKKDLASFARAHSETFKSVTRDFTRMEKIITAPIMAMTSPATAVSRLIAGRGARTDPSVMFEKQQASMVVTGRKAAQQLAKASGGTFTPLATGAEKARVKVSKSFSTMKANASGTFHAMGAAGGSAFSTLNTAGSKAATQVASTFSVEATRIGTALRGVFAMTGWGLLAIAIGMVAFKLVDLGKAFMNLDAVSGGSLSKMRSALKDLNDEMARSADLRKQLREGRDTVESARTAQQQAQAGLEFAQDAKAGSTAAKGTMAARNLTLQLATARQKLAQATTDLSIAEKHHDVLVESLNTSQREAHADVAKTTAEFKKQIHLFVEGSHVVKAFGKIPIAWSVMTKEGGHKGIDALIDRMHKLAQSSKDVDSKVGAALETIGSMTGKISDKDITLAVRLAIQGKSVKEIVARIAQIKAHINVKLSTAAQAARNFSGNEGLRLRGMTPSQSVMGPYVPPNLRRGAPFIPGTSDQFALSNELLTKQAEASAFGSAKAQARVNEKIKLWVKAWLKTKSLSPEQTIDALNMLASLRNKKEEESFAIKQRLLLGEAQAAASGLKPKQLAAARAIRDYILGIVKAGKGSLKFLTDANNALAQYNQQIAEMMKQSFVVPLKLQVAEAKAAATYGKKARTKAEREAAESIKSDTLKQIASGKLHGEALIAAYNTLATQRGVLAQKEAKSVSEHANLLKTAIGQVTDAIDSARTSIGELFQGPFLNPTDRQKKMTLGLTGPTAGNLTKDLNSQINQYTKFQKMLSKLAKRGAPAELIKELNAKGPESLPEVMALANASGPALKKFFAAFSKREKMAVRAAVVQLRTNNVNLFAKSIAGGLNDKQLKKFTETGVLPIEVHVYIDGQKAKVKQSVKQRRGGSKYSGTSFLTRS